MHMPYPHKILNQGDIESMPFNELILKKRQERKLSLRRAAKEIGISHTSLFYIEQGTSEPRANTFMKVLNYYEIGLDDLEYFIQKENKHHE